jgi:hypothetical protein
MRKTEVVTELAKEGYKLFLRPLTGSVLEAEAWANSSRDKKLVIILYRRDTDEMIDSRHLPDDEENKPEIEAFVDDFEDRIFRPGVTLV